MKKWRAIDITMVALFVALMAIGANVTSFLVIGGVPITLQTFFAIMAGLLLGKRLGAVAMLCYMLIGLAGFPIFSGLSGGLRILFSPTFGFILSYILLAFTVGWIREKNSSLAGFIISSFVGLILNYLFGTNWMYFSYKWWAQAPDSFSYAVAWSWMLIPLIKDIIFTAVAGIIAYRLNNAYFKRSSLKIH
ncbi:biotin transporter BioY [Bacillus sp. Au-Bac7]|uniref:biotin transporter BioY n=1 Tax=Bacillus sp. Au-Bac7 TaxID=2906458 RepID=UPI001E2CDAF9|nr:biotin transporter BioY [Bacillus sp. Au-Bac7]MCE4047584.1 biotin transporter BioY [Bacillus sp. Au-Bac7]